LITPEVFPILFYAHCALKSSLTTHETLLWPGRAVVRRPLTSTVTSVSVPMLPLHSATSVNSSVFSPTTS